MRSTFAARPHHQDGGVAAAAATFPAVYEVAEQESYAIARRSLFYDDGPVSCAVLTMHTAAYDGQGPS